MEDWHAIRLAYQVCILANENLAHLLHYKRLADANGAKTQVQDKDKDFTLKKANKCV